MRVLRKKERNKGLKNWKAKLSMLMVLCLVLTGSHGLVLSADAQEEQGGSPNRIESRGDNVKLHFKGEDLRQAAEAAIYEGVKFSITESLSYSKDPELLQLYRDSLAEGKELYEISLDNFVNGTEAVYQETGAKVRAIVEIDPTERTGEIEKQGKDALGFFAKDSSFGKLMEQGNPDWYEEALAPEREKERLALEKSEADKAKEEKAAQSQEENAEQATENSESTKVNTETSESTKVNTETSKEETSTENKSQEEILKEVENAKAPDFINLDAKKEDYVVQGTELIHFLYENHGEQDLRFQLFVDSNSYPGVKVQSKAKLAKSILEDVKSLEDKIKKTNAKKDGEEQEVKQNTEALPSIEQSNESLVSSEESQSTELTTATVAGQGSETLVTTEESKSAEASASVGESQEQSSVVITEVKGEEENKKEKVKNSQENPILALYQEMKEDITPFLSELYTAKYQIYSLNELGRKSQHKELDDFGVVEVFYDKEAFPEAVTLQVSKMVKPEEAKADESKLSDAQVEALKVRGYYEDSRSIDIHFVNAEGVEVEPTLPVAVRISISKDTLPKEAKPENIAIHHLVEEEGSDKIAYVETVSDTEKNAKNVIEENAKATEELTKKEEEAKQKENKEEKEKKENQSEEKNDKTEKNAYIVREFNVKSFSVYTISWSNKATSNKVYKFYYLDGDFRQIGASVSVDMSAFEKEAFLYQTSRYPRSGPVFDKDGNFTGQYKPYDVYNIYPNIPGYTRHDKVYPSYYSLEEIQISGNREDISWGNEVYFMTSRHVITFLNYTYYQQTGDWGAVQNMTTWDGNYKDPYYPDRDVCAGYYYFFYTLDKKPHDHYYPKHNLTMEQEKYITKLADGSYDITLTAKPVIEGGEKNKLDVIIVYDKSYYMGFPFNKSFAEGEKEYQQDINEANGYKQSAKVKKEAEKANLEAKLAYLENKERTEGLTEYEIQQKKDIPKNIELVKKDLESIARYSIPDRHSDQDKRVVKDNSRLQYTRSEYSQNSNASKDAYGKILVKSLVGDLTKNPAYDVQFALVAMGGQRTLNRKSKNDSNHTMELTSITDAPDNDAEKLIGFTKDIDAFNAKLDSIKPEDPVTGGLNYAAGLKEAVDFQNDAKVGANTNSIRQDARRVVLFITSHNPNFSYFNDLNTDKNGGFQDFYFLNGVSNMVGNKRVFGKVPGKVEDKGKVDVSTSSAPNATATIEAYSFKTSDFKDGYSYGSGVGYEQSAFTQARAELTKLNKIDAFFTWGLGPKENYSQLEKLTKKSPRWMVSGHPEEQPLDDSIEQDNFYLDSSVRDDLVKKKNEIRNTIAPIHINLMKIWDRLSENVELNFDYNNETERKKKLRKEIWKLDAQGKPSVIINNPTSADGFSGFKGLHEKYDAVKRTIEMYNEGDFFAFPEGYEYHLTVNVRPTMEAYKKYQKNFMDYFDKETERLIKSNGGDIGYLDNVNGDNIDETQSIPLASLGVKKGDIRTDQWYLYQKTPEEQFHTSSQKDGFYSNEGAYLIYQRFRGRNDPEQPKNKYQKPVIQIEPASLRVVKTFLGTNSSTEELELLKNTSFLLEQEKDSHPGEFEEVKRFSMTKSETDSGLGYLVSEELKGTSLTGTGKNLTPAKPAGTLQTVMSGGMKQYVLSINGLIPGKKYRVSEVLGSKGENPIVEGTQFHFKKMEVTAGADSNTAIGGGKSEYAIVTMGKNETKEIKVQNTYEGDGKRALRIEKRTSGEMADTNQSFPFQLKLVKANGQAINQSDFNTLKASFSAETKGAISFSASNSAISFNLKHGQGLEFILPKDLSFSVGENPSGYLPSVSTSYVLQQATDAQGFRFTKARKIKDIPGTAKIILQFHNVKDPISPTGVVDEARPLAMVFTAFILFSGAIAFGMKKKEEG